MQSSEWMLRQFQPFKWSRVVEDSMSNGSVSSAPKNGADATKSASSAATGDKPTGSMSPYTPETLAQRWNCSEQLVRNLCNSKKLKSFKVGDKLIRIAVEDVVAFEKGQIPQ
jgi:Helix-turn-helix domain